jgi:hypothetical protein
MGEEPEVSAPALVFVPVELLRPIVARPEQVPPARPSTGPKSPPPIAEAEASWGERTSLFGDLEA